VWIGQTGSRGFTAELPEGRGYDRAVPEAPAEPVAISSKDGVVTARLGAGPVETRQAAMLLDRVKPALESAGTGLRLVVLDFGVVDFINSSGLAACVELRNAADAAGAPTVIHRPSTAVEDLFRMVKLDRLYEFTRDDDDLRRLLPA